MGKKLIEKDEMDKVKEALKAELTPKPKKDKPKKGYFTNSILDWYKKSLKVPLKKPLTGLHIYSPKDYYKQK